MKRLSLILLIIPSLAYAGDEEFTCSKNHHDYAVECKAGLNGVAVREIVINGGGCESVVHPGIHHKVMKKGDKFTVPGSKECSYVSGVTVYTHSGKTLHFHAM